MADLFVDLTQRKGGKREVRLTPEDLKIIKENPAGLTKEGCMVKVWLWSQSDNFHLLVRYLAMYKLCDKFVESGNLENGAVILSRHDHILKSGVKKKLIWSEHIGKKNNLGEVIIAESVEELEKFVKERLSDLNFITNKG